MWERDRGDCPTGAFRETPSSRRATYADGLHVTMPRKLLILVILMVIGLLLDGLQLFLSDFATRQIIVTSVHVAILIGLLRGNEALRGVLIVLGWLGIGATALMGVRLLSSGLDRLFDVAPGLAALAIGSLVFAAGFCGYMIWCLGQRDVQRWMYARSMGGAALDE
jgi:hypothetical protein